MVLGTGTGKTLSFALPIVEKLLLNPPQGRGRKPVVLVMAPTRELARQVKTLADEEEEEEYILLLYCPTVAIFLIFFVMKMGIGEWRFCNDWRSTAHNMCLWRGSL